MGNKNWGMLRELDGNTSSVLGHQVAYTLHLLLFVSPSRCICSLPLTSAPFGLSLNLEITTKSSDLAIVFLVHSW